MPQEGSFGLPQPILTPLPAVNNPNNGMYSGNTSSSNSIMNNVPGWTCKPMNSPPLCPAAQSNLCKQMTCVQVVAAGKCRDITTKTTDWTNRTVTQYCASECGGCEASPSLRTSMDALPSDFCCTFPAGQYWQDDAGQLKTAVEL